MPETPVVYWDILAYKALAFHLAATDAGLCYIALPNETFDTLQDWATKHIPRSALVRDRIKMAPYLEQVNEYLNARRKIFSIPLDLRGTPFQIKVWRALLEIRFGETKSYSQIAESVGNRTAVRAVGAANGANPIPIVLPCHRVIGKNGRLTGYRGGMNMKANLLALEGVPTEA